MFFNNRQVIGLDIGSSSIKMAEFQIRNKTCYLSKIGMSLLPTGLMDGGEVRDPSLLGQNIKALHKELSLKNKNVCVGVFGGAVIVKKISMPQMDLKLLGEQIRWEAEQYIPFDMSEVNLDYHLINRGSSKKIMEVLIVAAKQDYVIGYLEAMEVAGLKCSILDVNGFALANCFEFMYGTHLNESVALVNIGAQICNLVILEAGHVVFCRDIPVGGNSYNGEISRELNVTYEEAEELKISAVYSKENPSELLNIFSSINDSICGEIKNSFEFYQTANQDFKINTIYLSGGSVHIPSLVESISNATGVDAQVFNPMQKIKYNRRVFTQDYMTRIQPFLPIVLGLGLRKVGDS